MKTVRMGVIGLGNIGKWYASDLLNGRFKGATLTAVANPSPSKLSPFRKAGVAAFTDAHKLIHSGEVDAVLIATPHLHHVPIGIDALGSGLHVLMEKPIAVRLSQAQRLIAKHTKRRQVFAAMFNMRVDPRFAKIHELVKGDTLGKIQRVNWIFTEWYRTQAYYDSAEWRGTWSGEGGGILVNQLAHHLDIIQWILGMPETVWADCQMGKHHWIEVEDDVTAYLKYKKGFALTFTASNGEVPGTNRFEIIGDRGAVILDGNSIKQFKNIVPVSEHMRKAKGPMDRPKSPCKTSTFTVRSGLQAVVVQNFIDAIRKKATLIAPAKEGLGSAELANAMLLSSHAQQTVPLPLNTTEFDALFDDLSKA